MGADKILKKNSPLIMTPCMAGGHFPNSHIPLFPEFNLVMQILFTADDVLLCLTFDAEAAGIQCGTLGSGDNDLQTQLLQRPAVGLGHILAGSGDVSLWHKQAAEAHVDVLEKGERKMTVL